MDGSMGPTRRPGRPRALTALAVLLWTVAATVRGADQAVPEVLASYPHDPAAYTQGLLLHDGLFYESTGLYGESSLREVDPATGQVLRRLDLDGSLFGEGLARVDDRLVQLTYRAGTAFVRNMADFAFVETFTYPGQGWGLCDDGQRLVMSDGSAMLQFRDREDFSLLGEVEVTLDGTPVERLNELECVGKLVYANVFLTDTILRIDPDTGEVLTEIDAAGLLTPEQAQDAYVLNGIAFDPQTEHFFLTGKLWPLVFEVAFDFDPYEDLPPCLPGALPPVERMRVFKQGLWGVVFSWLPADDARWYHVNAVSAATDLQGFFPHRPPLPGARGTAVCDARAPDLSCGDLQALSDPTPIVFYRAFAACGLTGEDEGP